MPQSSYRLRFGEELPVYVAASSPLHLKLPPGPILERLAVLRRHGDPRQMVSGWTLLCARMLGLGWVGPAFGADCLAVPQGLRNTTALHRIEQYLEPSAALAAMEASLLSLAQGVGVLLNAKPDQTIAPIRDEFHFFCREQIQQGSLLPPPLAQAVLQRPAFDRIVDELRW